MSVTYYVALPFVRTEDGVAPGEAQEMPNEGAAIRRAESMSRDCECRRARIQTKRRSEHGKFQRRYNFEIVRRGSNELGRIVKARGASSRMEFVATFIIFPYHRIHFDLHVGRHPCVETAQRTLIPPSGLYGAYRIRVSNTKGSRCLLNFWLGKQLNIRQLVRKRPAFIGF
jgi:hypothetical protein